MKPKPIQEQQFNPHLMIAVAGFVSMILSPTIAQATGEIDYYSSSQEFIPTDEEENSINEWESGYRELSFQLEGSEEQVAANLNQENEEEFTQLPIHNDYNTLVSRTEAELETETESLQSNSAFIHQDYNKLYSEKSLSDERVWTVLGRKSQEQTTVNPIHNSYSSLSPNYDPDLDLQPLILETQKEESEDSLEIAFEISAEQKDYQSLLALQENQEPTIVAARSGNYYGSSQDFLFPEEEEFTSDTENTIESVDFLLEENQKPFTVAKKNTEYYSSIQEFIPNNEEADYNSESLNLDSDILPSESLSRQELPTEEISLSTFNLEEENQEEDIVNPIHSDYLSFFSSSKLDDELVLNTLAEDSQETSLRNSIYFGYLSFGNSSNLDNGIVLNTLNKEESQNSTLSNSIGFDYLSLAFDFLDVELDSLKRESLENKVESNTKNNLNSTSINLDQSDSSLNLNSKINAAPLLIARLTDYYSSLQDFLEGDEGYSLNSLDTNFSSNISEKELSEQPTLTAIDLDQVISEIRNTTNTLEVENAAAEELSEQPTLTAIDLDQVSSKIRNISNTSEIENTAEELSKQPTLTAIDLDQVNTEIRDISNSPELENTAAEELSEQPTLTAIDLDQVTSKIEDISNTSEVENAAAEELSEQPTLTAIDLDQVNTEIRDISNSPELENTAAEELPKQPTLTAIDLDQVNTEENISSELKLQINQHYSLIARTTNDSRNADYFNSLQQFLSIDESNNINSLETDYNQVSSELAILAKEQKLTALDLDKIVPDSNQSLETVNQSNEVLPNELAASILRERNTSFPNQETRPINLEDIPFSTPRNRDITSVSLKESGLTPIQPNSIAFSPSTNQLNQSAKLNLGSIEPLQIASLGNEQNLTTGLLQSDASFSAEPLTPFRQQRSSFELVQINDTEPEYYYEDLIESEENTSSADADLIAPETNKQIPSPAPTTLISPEGTPMTQIVVPADGAVLDTISSSLILRFPEGASVKLQVNGNDIDPSLIGRSEVNKTTQIVTQTWYGIIFQPGENTITAQATLNEVTGTEISSTVIAPGIPTVMEIETVEARIPADGRSTATVRGQLLDEDGSITDRNVVVTLDSSAGEFIGADYHPDQPGFQINAQEGQFAVRLRSGLEAQTVRIRAQALKTLEAFTQIQFETALRKHTILSGVVDIRFGSQGTDYYSSFRDFLPDDEDNEFTVDVDSAVFATGSIGEWQFTGAYNSDRSLNKDCNCNNRLFRTQQSTENQYQVYGDSSTTQVVAPSTDQVYFRLERSSRIRGADPDYFLWGDYNTQEFATRSQEFTSVTRQLHGFKTNYNFGNLQISGFFGTNVEGFQRDTIPPDGTAGFYFLSRRLLIPGSEDVFIELEELNRPGTVLQRERLTRSADYDIDYDRGTLLFKQPILRTGVGEEGEVLIRRIVVTYQFESEGEDTEIFAGRARYHLSREINQERWIGATYLREDKGDQDFELYGADAYISFGEKAHLIAEYARSTNNSVFSGEVTGNAYRVELEGQFTDEIYGRAYYRSAEEGFANDATTSFVPGQTRYGASVQAQVTSTTNVRVRFDREENFGVAPRPLNDLEEFLTPTTEPVPGSRVDNNLTTILAGVQQKFGSVALNVDWIYRDRKDNLNSNLDSTSNQLRSRLSVPITKNITFKALNETTLSSETDTIFTDRTAVGLDWSILPGIKVSLAQQWFTRGQFEGQGITSLGIGGDYKIAQDTTLSARYVLVGGINEMIGQGSIGLNQKLTIAPGLLLDLSYERVFGGDIFGRTASGTRFRQPFAVGQGASALGLGEGESYSVGIGYTDNPDFKVNARFEQRNSPRGSNTVISANASGKISPALTALFTYNQASSSNPRLEDLGDTINLRLGLAYRNPSDDKFNALLRYEYRQNPSIIPDTILFGNGTGSEEHVFAAEMIYAPSWRWEFYGKYAFRKSTTFLAEDFVADSTINLAQLRATYRLGYNIDLVGEARWITQPSANFSEVGFVVEAGYYLTPELRLYAGYALGDIDDPDLNGSRSAGGPYAGVAIKLNGLFDGFGQQPVAPPQQQESQVISEVDS